MSKALSRRAFLKSSAASIAATSLMSPLQMAFGESCTSSGKTIVQIDLSGGLASHMFLAPMAGSALDSYLRFNPTVGLGRTANIPNNQTRTPLPITGSTLGLNPVLVNFHKMANADVATPWRCAVINKTGYPQPDGSHEQSRMILETGVRYNNTNLPGWVGKIMESYCRGKSLPVFSFAGNARELNSAYDTSAVLDNLGSFARSTSASNSEAANYRLRYDLAKAIRSAESMEQIEANILINKTLTSIDGLESSVAAANNSYAALTQGTAQGNRAAYPNNGLAGRLREVAKVIRGGLAPTVCLVDTGGYDLHGNTDAGTINRLTELDSAVAAFLEDLRLGGVQDKVIIVSKTDFGRNSFENGNTQIINNQAVLVPGHDHGAASLSFVIGTDVIAGIHGPEYNAVDFENPRVAGTTGNGVIMPQVDFREVRAQVLARAGIDPAIVQTDATRLAPVGLRLFA